MNFIINILLLIYFIYNLLTIFINLLINKIQNNNPLQTLNYKILTNILRFIN